LFLPFLFFANCMTFDSSASRPRLALFDLDHTLLPLDSDYEWGEFTTRIGWTDPQEFSRRNAEFYAHYQAGTLDIHDYVRFATEAVRRQGPQAAAAAHARFMQEVIAPAIRPQALSVATPTPASRRPGHHHHSHQ
jgi:phosphoserine phosphatase